MSKEPSHRTPSQQHSHSLVYERKRSTVRLHLTFWLEFPPEREDAKEN
jgi:hypothetical protein